MLYDRREWANHVMNHAPDVADFLKEAHELFGARVMKMETGCEDCAWERGVPWTAERAVIPYVPPEARPQGKEKIYKIQRGVTSKWIGKIK